MKDLLEHYEILNKVRENSRNVLYQARSRKDNRLVILKIRTADETDREQQRRFHREFELMKLLAGTPGVVNVLDFLETNTGDAIVMEYFPGQTLGDFLLRKKTSAEDFFHLVQRLVLILDGIHRKNIVHKDLSPSNILINPETGDLLFIDFGLSTLLTRQAPDYFSAVLEGTPWYISPEQTGRANLAVDYRSDFYSLGMLLYHLSTGVLPFESSDMGEMIHFHLAKVPMAPKDRGTSLLEEGIPDGLSDLILKLCAKSPQDRYQSTAGLLFDLDLCRKYWEQRLTIPLVLGQADFLDRLEVPQKAYGRETEVCLLKEILGRVQEGGRRTVFVTGEGGVGKTTLVKELYSDITAGNCRFLQGKYDRLKGEIPYHGLIQALECWVDQIVSGPPAEKVKWREILKKELQFNCGVLVSLVPGFKLLLEDVPAAEDLITREAENRLFLTLAAFFGALSRKDQPLVLFLDDMQWCDPASTRVLEHLIFSAEFTHLLFICSYRDQEILASTPFRNFIQRSREGGKLEEIHLKGLDFQTLWRMTSDTLHRPLPETKSLAQVLQVKTRGNPFYFIRLLQIARDEGFISFNPLARTWTWDVTGIGSLAPGEDVVSLLAGAMDKLPEAQKRCLWEASCLGHRFSLKDLQKISRNPEELNQALSALVESDYLAPLDRESDFLAFPDQVQETGSPWFRFRHDSLQEAAYGLFSAAERTGLHLAIARSMGTGIPSLTSRILPAAFHYNQAETLLGSPEDRLFLAEVNLSAGQKALDSSMFEQAQELFRRALRLWDGAGGSEPGEKRVQALRGLMDTCFILKMAEEGEALVAELEGQITDPILKAEILQRYAYYLNFLGRLRDSLVQSLRALEILGISLPLDPSGEELYGKILAIGEKLGPLDLEQIRRMPECRDGTVNRRMGLLAGCIIPAFMSGNQNLFVLASLTAIGESLDHGHSPESAIAFSNYAILLSGMGQYQPALAYAELAIELNQRFRDPQWKAFIHSSYTLFNLPWTRPWKEFTESSRRTIDIAFQTGDLFILAYQSTYVVAWNESLRLPAAISGQQEYQKLIAQTGQRGPWAAGEFLIQKWKSWSGLLPSRYSLDGEGFLADELADALAEQQNFSALAIYHLHTMEILCSYGDFPKARESWKKATALIAALAGSAYMAEYSLFGFLIHKGLLDRGAPGEEREEYLTVLKSELERTAGWAASCPENFRAVHLLLQALYSLITGEPETAKEWFQQTFQALDSMESLGMLALIHQAAGESYLTLGDKKNAAYLLADAWRYYGRWGAGGIQKYLEEKYPQILFQMQTKGESRDLSLSVSSTIQRSDELMDSRTLLQSSLAISQEMDFPSLLKKVLSILMESAGATHGWIALQKTGTLKVFAWGDVQGGIFSSSEGTVPEAAGLKEELWAFLVRSSEAFTLDSAWEDGRFSSLKDTLNRRIRSMLYMPLTFRNETLGFIYLENSLLDGAFSQGKAETVRALGSQVAVSLENARMYQSLDQLNRSLEVKVAQRTEELAQRNREILSGMEYASLLQKALLPSQEQLRSIFKDHLILWKPRDLVGGDTYWVKSTPEGFLAVVVDCTGHGVPGALMSMAAHANLNSLYASAQQGSSGDFLSRLHRLTQDTLNQQGGEHQDGLDIGICFYEKASDSLTFSGARIGLGVAEKDSFRFLKGDRISLGYPDGKAQQSFQVHRVEGASEKTFYLFSDGFSSQLGGGMQLPFGKARFTELLEGIHCQPLKDQENLLKMALKEHQGDWEQIDDITVLGFSIRREE